MNKMREKKRDYHHINKKYYCLNWFLFILIKRVFLHVCVFFSFFDAFE